MSDSENPFQLPDNFSTNGELAEPEKKIEVFRDTPLPAPSILISIVAFVSFFVAQIFAFIVVMILLVLYNVVVNGVQGQGDIQEILKKDQLVISAFIVFSVSCSLSWIFTQLGLGFTKRREDGFSLGKGHGNGLGAIFSFDLSYYLKANAFRGMPLLQWLLIFVIAPPVILCCNELVMLLNPLLPNIEALQQPLEDINKLGVFWGILFVGVMPGIAEELLFRGYIGRGLVARFGVVPGVLLTSFLFGLAHLNPPTVVGTFLLGIFFHIVYLQTKSIFAPMLLHTLNNSAAVIILNYPTLLDPISESGDLEGHVKVLVFLPACFALVCTIFYLRSRRTFWKNEAGNEFRLWYPGPETPNVPLKIIPAIVENQGASNLILFLLSYSILAGIIAFYFLA